MTKTVKANKDVQTVQKVSVEILS